MTDNSSKTSWFRKKMLQFYRLFCCVPNPQTEEKSADVSMGPEVVVESMSMSDTDFIDSVSTESVSSEMSIEDLGQQPRVRIIQPLVIREDGVKED